MLPINKSENTMNYQYYRMLSSPHFHANVNNIHLNVDKLFALVAFSESEIKIQAIIC